MVTLLSRYVNNLRKDRRTERSATRQTLRPPQRALAAISKRSLVICTPPDARGSILRDCNHLWRVTHPTGRQGRIKAPFAGTICSTPFLKLLLFEHGREALYRVRGRLILRSSQSPSNALTPEGPFAGCAFHHRGRIVESLHVRKPGDS